MESYFDLPRIGELTIEHQFYVLNGEPILFVCKDAKDARYLCSCCLMYEQWVIARTDESALVDLIDDKIAIRNVFESRNSMVILVSWDGNKFDVDTAAPSDLFPKIGAKLELPYERTGSYYTLLKQKAQQDMWLQAFGSATQSAVLAWQVYINFSTTLCKCVQPILSEYAGIQEGSISTHKEFATYISKIFTSETMKRLADTEINTVADTPTKAQPMKVAKMQRKQADMPGLLSPDDYNYYAA